MLRTMAALIAAVTVMGGCGGEPAGGGPAAPPAAPPSAAELVADAQQALGDAGTGHFDHALLALVGDGSEKVVWQSVAGDYDLPRRVYSGELRLANSDLQVPGWRYIISVVATAEASYRAWVVPRNDRGPRWHRSRTTPDQEWSEPGTAPPAAAVLAFRPDGTEPDDDGDTWIVSGTLPVPVALELVGAMAAEVTYASDVRALHAATGTAVARLVVGVDRKVRELLVAGVDIDATSALPDATLKDLPRQSARTTFSAYAKQVTVLVPPADEITDEPLSFGAPGS